MKAAKRILLPLLITVILGFAYFYVTLPALNLHNPDFYIFVFMLSAAYCVISLILNGQANLHDPRGMWASVKSTCKIPVLLCAALVVIYILGTLFSSVILRSGSYKQLLTVESGDFASEVEEISFDKIPMLDKASAQRLGDRKLGELSDMVSQFEVANDYNQINYKAVPVRVATLEYGDVFKWFNNRKNGLPGYIIIDMITQNVEVVRLDEGIKYSAADHFSRNIYRHLRFHYPTFLFDTPHFEIDDQGAPWWVCPRVEKTIGMFGGTDINGAVLVNAVTGECSYYEAAEVPTWVDLVYSAGLIIEQYDYYGKYQNGFINSMFGQTGVTVTTAGYNYIAMNDDVYMYTGITSVGGDESNVGFILSNQRTKETKYYSCAGAEEFSAMSSAQGVVQHLNYSATFPLLLNIADQPTYFMALKDNAGLVKMYAMVNVQQYNIVATGSTVAECEAQYHTLLSQNHITVTPQVETVTLSGTVAEIRTAVIDGNSFYYFRLEGRALYYAVSAADSQQAVIVNPGDRVVLTIGKDAAGDIIAAQKIELQ